MLVLAMSSYNWFEHIFLLALASPIANLMSYFGIFSRKYRVKHTEILYFHTISFLLQETVNQDMTVSIEN